MTLIVSTGNSNFRHCVHNSRTQSFLCCGGMTAAGAPSHAVTVCRGVAVQVGVVVGKRAGNRLFAELIKAQVALIPLSLPPQQIILNSMHRFQPRIYLVIRPEGATGPIVDLEREFYRSYIFPETIFTAVTAYQNQLVKTSISLNKMREAMGAIISQW